MSRKSRGIGAWDLMQQLNADPEWVEQDRLREEKRRAFVEQQKAELKPEEEPLNLDLADVGYEVDSVWNLVNAKESYPAAISVLLKHLPVVKHPVLRQGIARALTVKEARGVAGEVLLRELQRPDDDEETRWTLANALTVAADRNDAAGIRALADDPRYKDVHERLGQALKNLF